MGIRLHEGENINKYNIFNPKSKDFGFSLESFIICEEHKMLKALLPAGYKKYNK